MKYVYLWRSPDGVMVFGSRKRAKAYVEHCHEDPIVWEDEERFSTAWDPDADREEDDWLYSVVKERVQ